MKKVLYAEDEYTNRKLLEIKLRNRGVQCDLAEDGTRALEMFKSGEYGVIVLDQYMPGMNGDKVATEIRKIDPEIPLIAITSDDGEMERLRSAGFNRIFIKPVRGEDYIGTILSYLE